MTDPNDATVEDVHAALGIGVRFVKARVFAASIGLNIRTIDRYFAAGKLHRHRIGKAVYVDVTEAAELIAERAGL